MFLRKARSLTDQPSASIPQSVSNLVESGMASEDDVDPYWTLVMYYNSLRELGSGQSSLSQNIPRWVETYSQSTDSGPRSLTRPRELTSRRSGTELTRYRSELNMGLGSEQGPIDVLSSSNMFQVGIDIPRLGVMEIIGQPRSNSEYIQSSGRIGRNSPGLVVSLLRGSFPRDQSHFELFRAFHQEFYRHVDRTSITPFTHRALERAFESMLMMMLRMGCKPLSRNSDLSNLNQPNNVRVADRLVKKFEETIRGRTEAYESHFDIIVLDQAINEVSRALSRAKSFARFCAQAPTSPAWWIVWNDHERANMNPEPKSLFSSPFRTNFETEEEDLVDSISSMRDITPEILLQRNVDVHSFMTSMPESHYFGHMSPGSIWESSGIPKLTHGISRWNNGTRENDQFGAL